MNGDLAVDSRLGATRFVLSLPLAKNEEDD